MPIYCDLKKKYKIVTIEDIKPKDILTLRKIINDAKISFDYNLDQSFTSSVETFSEYNLNMARFNILGTGLTEHEYIIRLDSFLAECNRLLHEKRISRFNNLKFDIMGSWTRGQIILMALK